MPALGVRLKVWILHQRVILEQRLPILLVLAVSPGLPGELFDRYLVAVEVLEAQVAEVRGLVLFKELDFNVRLAGPVLLCLLLVAD